LTSSSSSSTAAAAASFAVLRLFVLQYVVARH
jgi:hypothetical protein